MKSRALKTLIALVDRAVVLGYRIRRAEDSVKHRSEEAAIQIQRLWRRVLDLTNLRGNPDRIIWQDKAERPISISNGFLLYGASRLSDIVVTKTKLPPDGVRALWEAFPEMLKKHVNELEHDCTQADETNILLRDAYYTLLGINALIDAPLPAKAKSVLVQRALADTKFRDAMDAIEDTDEDGALTTFLTGQHEDE